MSSKQAEYEQLCSMINRGVTSLEVNGEKVAFRSLAEMHRIKANLEIELGIGSTPSRIHYPTVRRD